MSKEYRVYETENYYEGFNSPQEAKAYKELFDTDHRIEVWNNYGDYNQLIGYLD